jgi:hypothetical protein
LKTDEKGQYVSRVCKCQREHRTRFARRKAKPPTMPVEVEVRKEWQMIVAVAPVPVDFLIMVEPVARLEYDEIGGTFWTDEDDIGDDDILGHVLYMAAS